MKNTLLALHLCLLLVLPACQETEPLPPISEAELTGIITEALILEPAGREVAINYQDSVSRIYYSRILAEHDYTLEEFTESMRWLQAEPDRLVSVYNQVMENLTVIDSNR